MEPAAHVEPRPVADSGALERARQLTLRYLVASTAIFLVAGLLGVLMRDSQADLGRLEPNFFYAVMTAHGLGNFVGWAGFALMGLSFWVLASVGFPLRRFGSAMGEATFWLMVAGVAGVVVTTLILHFAGSWVFLYPLPFHSAGRWSDWVTALFSFSVLLVGLSIVTWCLGILHTVLGPALHAVRPTLGNRLGLALGLGYLAPRRFATNPTPVPYAVIPLTVIAIDMTLATLPLAALLVIMIVQSAAPGVSVDPLLAKNILWFFGHPVVYLLLFPAVALYYLLIPRYAKRPLVAGNVVAIAWVIAVVVNVVIWAHHIYLDYPSGSPQAALNTAMQPLTFAITLPSALSLYSLLFTVYRSEFEWTAGSTALFLGLVGWLVAGFSGVVNATIAFDAVVHNTLWVVGHFHHMALLNIGMVIFGATYAFLPELTGKALYSERLARWHVWLTFGAGTVVFVLWLVQGLQGAPRRFAVLPSRYNDLTYAAIPFVFVLALAQLLFAWNLVQTLRGKAEAPERRAVVGRPPRQRLATATAEGLIVLLALGLAFAAGAVGWVIGHETRTAKVRTVTLGGTTAPPPATTSGATRPGAATTSAPSAGGAAAGDPVAGKAVFASAGCGGCHTLKAAGTSGTIGPNLDKTKPSLSLVIDRVRDGKGVMPSFKGRLTDKQIADVAAYVVKSASG